MVKADGDRLALYLLHIRRMAFDFHCPHLTDELESAGTAALGRCLDAYEPERGLFWPWACVRIRGAMLDALRRWSHYHRSTAEGEHLVSLDARDEDGHELYERVADDCAPDAVERMDLLRAIALVPAPLGEVFLRCALLGELEREVGAARGLSESRISQVYAQACRRLRRELA